jgi:hypothetical protein
LNIDLRLVIHIQGRSKSFSGVEEYIVGEHVSRED